MFQSRFSKFNTQKQDTLSDEELNAIESIENRYERIGKAPFLQKPKFYPNIFPRQRRVDTKYKVGRFSKRRKSITKKTKFVLTPKKEGPNAVTKNVVSMNNSSNKKPSMNSIKRKTKNETICSYFPSLFSPAMMYFENGHVFRQKEMVRNFKSIKNVVSRKEIHSYCHDSLQLLPYSQKITVEFLENSIDQFRIVNGFCSCGNRKCIHIVSSLITYFHKKDNNKSIPNPSNNIAEILYTRSKELITLKKEHLEILESLKRQTEKTDQTIQTEMQVQVKQEIKEKENPAIIEQLEIETNYWYKNAMETIKKNSQTSEDSSSSFSSSPNTPKKQKSLSQRIEEEIRDENAFNDLLNGKIDFSSMCSQKTKNQRKRKRVDSNEYKEQVCKRIKLH